MAVLLGLCLAMAGGFALATPYGEAPDEQSHFLYIEYLVRFGGLPPIGAGAYTNEAEQPPLYYLLGAAVIGAGRTLTGAPPLTDRLTPRLARDPRIVAPDWHGYTVVLHPPAQRWPLWPYAVRGLSILLGLGVVLLTYKIARTLLPPPAPGLAPLVATAFAALIPQANFIRASVSNGNLTDLIGAWIGLLLVQHLLHPYRSRRVILLGVALGLALLTKLTLAPLGLLAGLVVLVHRSAPWRRRLRDLLGLAGVVALLAGPFYLYRWAVYADPAASAAWAAMMPPDSRWHLGDLFWLTDPFRGFLWTSFWGVYGWQVILLPGWIYLACAGVTGLAILGGGILVVRRALTRDQQAACAVLLAALLTMYATIVLFSLRLIAWQGRLLYPALAGVCVLFGLGLAGLLLGPGAVRPAALLAPRQRRLASIFLPAVTAGLLALNLYSILLLVLPLLNGP